MYLHATANTVKEMNFAKNVVSREVDVDLLKMASTLPPTLKNAQKLISSNYSVSANLKVKHSVRTSFAKERLSWEILSTGAKNAMNFIA